MPLSVPEVQNMQMFRTVPRAHLVEFCAAVQSRFLVANEPLFVLGEPAEAAALVVAGRLSIELGGGGAAGPVADVWPGDAVGESGLLGTQSQRNATVIAAIPSAVILLDRRLFEAYPRNAAIIALELMLLTSMARRARASSARLERAWQATPAMRATPRVAAPSPKETWGQAMVRILGAGS